MKTIAPPAIDALGVYDSVVGVRRPEEVRIRLQTARGRIASAYESYGPGSASIVRLQPASTSPARPDDLRGNYSQSIPCTDLRGALFAHNQLAQCLLCSAARASTLDHYLPKEAYPEFAVFPLNLVPACPDCNLRKRTDFMSEDGRALFVHAYLDDLASTERFLFASVNGVPGDASVAYTVDTSALADRELAARLESHFDRLQLADSYLVAAATELSDQTALVRCMSASGVGPDGVRSYFSALAASVATARGLNNWRCALFLALAASREYCSAQA